jgi:hypothetical protein
MFQAADKRMAPLDRRRITRALDWCYLEHLNVKPECTNAIIKEENLSFDFNFFNYTYTICFLN